MSHTEQPFCCKRSFGGFTIAEMVVVLVLIGILAGSVVVSLAGRDVQYALRATSKDLTSCIGYAVTHTQHTRVPHRLVFDKAGEAYWVESLDAKTGDTFVAVRGAAGLPKRLPRGITVRLDGEPQNGSDEYALVVTFMPDYFEASLLISPEDDDREIRLEVLRDTGQVVEHVS